VNDAEASEAHRDLMFAVAYRMLGRQQGFLPPYFQRVNGKGGRAGR
jgi:hypothetical protein